jgi:hypothetical protein
MLALTGSRYFQNAKPGSDYDFFTQDSPEIRRQLLSEGFVKIPLIGRCGPNTKAIYRRGNVDVGLITDMARKLREQKIMSLPPARLLLRSLPKRGRIFFWNIIQQL